jgi:transposase-like protein
VRRRYCRLFPKTVETLGRDRERMVNCYRFPKDHGIHLRISNPVESPFSAVRLRTDAARRHKQVANAEALIWKIRMLAERIPPPQLARTTRGNLRRTAFRRRNAGAGN